MTIRASQRESETLGCSWQSGSLLELAGGKVETDVGSRVSQQGLWCPLPCPHLPLHTVTHTMLGHHSCWGDSVSSKIRKALLLYSGVPELRAMELGETSNGVCLILVFCLNSYSLTSHIIAGILYLNPLLRFFSSFCVLFVPILCPPLTLPFCHAGAFCPFSLVLCFPLSLYPCSLPFQCFPLSLHLTHSPQSYF